MTEKLKKCLLCINESLCKAWFRELKSAEECYANLQDYVSVYDRFVIDGDGCEYFTAETVCGQQKYEPLTLDELQEMNHKPIWIQNINREM